MAVVNEKRRRPIDNPYEVWQTSDGAWEWRVLKKYQNPEQEARNPYARWHCAVRSPMTHGSWEMGDVYARDITQYAVKVSP